MITPADAHTRRRTVDTPPRARTASINKNQVPAAIELHNAARILIRAAYDTGMGSRPNACAMRTNSGLPGGCGRPSTFAAAMYSLVSHSAVVGASVAR